MKSYLNLVQQVLSIFGAKIFFLLEGGGIVAIYLFGFVKYYFCFWNWSMHVSLRSCKAFKIFLVREITLKILFAFPFHLTTQWIGSFFKAILVLGLSIWGLDCWGNFLSFFLKLFLFNFLPILGNSSFFPSLTHCYREYLSCHISQNLKSAAADCSFYYIRHNLMPEISIYCKSTLNSYD